MEPNVQDSRAAAPSTQGPHVDRPQSPARPTATATPAPAVPVAAPAASSELILPPTVVSRADISKALRELEAIDDYFHQAAIRGAKDQAMPTLSNALDGLASANSLNMLHGEDRTRLKEFLTRLKAKAPVVHMSFPSEASAPFLGKILEWFRAEAHPHTVLHVGLQPELAAGFMVRTTNKSFDFSFRKRFEQSKVKLITALEAMDKEAAASMTAQSQQPQAAAVQAEVQPNTTEGAA